MQDKRKQFGLRGRKNALWLRKRICERAGLMVLPQPSRHIRFGFSAYLIEIPDRLPTRRAIMTALRLKRSRKRLKLGHVANGLMDHAGRNAFWSNHALARMGKAKAR